MKTRDEILATLLERRWYQDTAITTQWLLKSLPANCDGVLQQLADRPEEGGGVRIVRLCQLDVPNNPGGPVFGAVVVFEVETLDDKKAHYTYQYHCWKQGPKSGTKGVVLIAKKRTHGKSATADDITHVVCLKGFSFAVGAETFDCVGGFADKPGLKLGPQFLEELAEELGVSQDVVQEQIALGDFYPDRGQTANCPELAAVVIDAGDIKKGHDNPDQWEMRSGGVVVPVAKLWGPEGFVMRNQDGYFGVCLLRLLALGRIKGPA